MENREDTHTLLHVHVCCHGCSKLSTYWITVACLITDSQKKKKKKKCNIISWLKLTAEQMLKDKFMQM